MSSELFDYIEAIKPSLGDAKRARIGLLIMHYITLARVSGGGVKIDNVLTTSGRSFAQKVIRHMSTVRSLAFALKIDMSCVYDDSPVPEGLKRLCDKYFIDVNACISRNKNLEDARSEMWDLVIFARVALAVMAALHEDTLRSLDNSYYGHRPEGYKSKSKWLGLVASDSTPAVRAQDLPRAKVPRAVGSKVPNATASGPVSMARKVSDESSAPSSRSSRTKSSAHKRPSIPRPVHPSVPMVSPQAPHIAQRVAISAYRQPMQQRMAGQRIH